MILVPTSEFSPMCVDTEAKKLFDESGISPIKCLPNSMETDVPERLDFEEDVDMTEEMEMDVTENLKKITIEDKEIPKTNQKEPVDKEDESESSIMDEVSQRLFETSLKVMAEHNPKLEELRGVRFHSSCME